MLSYKEISSYSVGFIAFSIYLRWILTPISLLTWANLNHSLCGTDTDPIWYLFDLGKWYYLLADFYLGAAAFAFIAINWVFCYIVKRVILGDKKCSHNIYDQGKEVAD